MKYPSTRIIYDRNNRASKTKQGLIQIEVVLQQKRKFISTGVKVFPQEWSDKTRVKNRADSMKLNKRIEAMLQNINDYIADLINKNAAWDWDKFERHLDREPNTKSTSFIQFVTDRIENRTDLREGTLKHHHSWLSDFINYGKIVSFSDINSTAIREYDDYLHKKGIKQTTIYNYHKHLKSYIIDAIEYEHIQYNPYNSVKIERGKAQEIRYLTYDDVQRIMHYDIEDPCLRRVRDIFIFQCHTGLAYADLASFRIENCTEKNGRLLYIGNRVKTEGRFTVMILPPAQDILKRYNNVLPVISNQKYNLYLKSIGNMLGIKTVVTSHVARHTFAVMAINHGVPIEIIAKMMGHTKIETTQIYAKVLNESIENAFLELEKKL